MGTLANFTSKVFVTRLQLIFQERVEGKMWCCYMLADSPHEIDSFMDEMRRTTGNANMKHHFECGKYAIARISAAVRAKALEHGAVEIDLEDEANWLEQQRMLHYRVTDEDTSLLQGEMTYGR